MNVTILACQTLLIPAGYVLTVPSGFTLTNYGRINNKGFFSITGNIINNNGSIIYNELSSLKIYIYANADQFDYNNYIILL